MGSSEAQALLSRSRGTAHSKNGSNQVLARKACADGMLSQWQSFLSQFEITYVPQKAIKGYAIAEHLAHLPLPVFDEIIQNFRMKI